MAVIKQVRFFFKKRPSTMIATFFADEALRGIFDPVSNGAELAAYAKADGVLIDTFDKDCGKGLLDWMDIKEIRRFAQNCHSRDQEAWIAGSIVGDQMSELWSAGVDVICVRGATCETGAGRQGKVSAELVFQLTRAIPKRRR